MVDSLSANLDALRINRPAPAPVARSRSWRWLVFVVFAGAAVGAVELRGLRPRLVRVGTVDQPASSEPAVDLTATGYLTAQRVAHLGAPISGRVSRVFVREGDHVRAGQALFELDDVERRAAVAALRAHALAGRARAGVARAQLAETRKQLDRTTILVAHEAEPAANADDLRQRLETEQSSLSAADADADAALADVEAGSAAFRDYVVRAPFDGIATTRPASVGDSVGPISTLVELIDPSSILLEADVPEARLGAVHAGMPCEVVLDAFPDNPIPGTVIGYGPRVERAKATGTVRVRLDGAAPLILPDMSARVRFLKAPRTVPAKHANPTVPVSAVTKRGGHDVVFVLDGEHVRAAAVTSGAIASGRLELEQGPSAGTHIVLSPPADLADGERVRTEDPSHE